MKDKTEDKPENQAWLRAQVRIDRRKKKNAAKRRIVKQNVEQSKD